MSINKPARISLLNLLQGKYDEAFPLNPSAYFYHKSLHERIGPYETQEHFGMDVHFVFKAVQNANVTYMDRTWGNYRYLESTKTFGDVKSGMNAVRVRAITEHYRRQQPVYLEPISAPRKPGRGSQAAPATSSRLPGSIDAGRALRFGHHPDL